MDKNNVYIIGKVVPHYRTQNLIKYLLDYGYNVHYNSIRNQIFIGKTGLRRLLRIFFLIFEFFVKSITSIYYIIISDVVILPAMCNKFQSELKIAKIFKKPIITDFYLSMYDTEVLDRMKYGVNSYQAKKLKKIDKNCIKYASQTIFLNSSEAEYYLNLLEIPFNNQIHNIIPLCVEESIKCKVSYFSENMEKRTFNICWWGTYIPLHGLENIIDACKVLFTNYDLNFHIYLFGTNDIQARPYKNLIQDSGVESFITIDNTKTFKNGKLGEFLHNNCDLVLGNFGNSEKAKNVLVNKLIDGVAMKAPVLTGESKAPLEFFSNNEIYYCKNSGEAIAKEIFNISQENKESIIKRVNRAYSVFENNFSISAYRNSIRKIIDKI